MKKSPLAESMRLSIFRSIFAGALGGLVLQSPAAEPRMGVWITNSDETLIDAYDSWTSATNSPIVDFGPNGLDDPTKSPVYDDWADLTGRDQATGALLSPAHGLGWAVQQWAPAYKSRVVWSIPMLPASGYNLAAGAAGSYDYHWRHVAQTLIEQGYGSSTIRLGWEFNGSWYPWHTNTSGEAANYKNYWKKIVLAMRSVAGANFKYNWCGSNGDQPSGIDPSLAYPDADASGSYVDEIGVDIYDFIFGNGVNIYPIVTGDAQWLIDTKRRNTWDDFSIYGTYNLNWWANFAITKNKPMTIPEWGLAIRQPYDSTHNSLPIATYPYGYGGGDDADFIQHMHQWIIDPAHKIVWHSYFQEDNDQIRSKMYGSSQYPLATQRFLNLFGGQPVFTLFQDPLNRKAWEAGYGTLTASVVGTDAGHAPFEGANQLKVTYTSSAGYQIGIAPTDLTAATHLRLARLGPVTNATQYLGVRLTAADGTSGPIVNVARSTTYGLVDIPLSSLSAGTNLAQINGIYFYFLPGSPAGVSDTVYLDNIVFLKKAP